MIFAETRPGAERAPGLFFYFAWAALKPPVILVTKHRLSLDTICVQTFLIFVWTILLSGRDDVII